MYKIAFTNVGRIVKRNFDAEIKEITNEAIVAAVKERQILSGDLTAQFEVAGVSGVIIGGNSIVGRFVITNRIAPKAPKNERQQVGAVLTFPEGTSLSEAKAILDRIKGDLESCRTETYNPDYGSPVFYIP